jgi:hypothetical protein
MRSLEKVKLHISKDNEISRTANVWVYVPYLHGKSTLLHGVPQAIAIGRTLYSGSECTQCSNCQETAGSQLNLPLPSPSPNFPLLSTSSPPLPFCCPPLMASDSEPKKIF